MTSGWLTEASIARSGFLFGLVGCDPAYRQIGPAMLGEQGPIGVDPLLESAWSAV